MTTDSKCQAYQSIVRNKPETKSAKTCKFLINLFNRWFLFLKAMTILIKNDMGFDGVYIWRTNKQQSARQLPNALRKREGSAKRGIYRRLFYLIKYLYKYRYKTIKQFIILLSSWIAVIRERTCLLNRLI